MKIKLLLPLIFVSYFSCLKSQLCLYPATSLTSGNNPTCVATADFNNDNKQDIAIGWQSGVNILLGNGDGTFSNAPNINLSLIRSLATADFNQDNNMDLVALSDFGLARVLLGNGSGSFSVSGVYPGCSHPLSVLTDDFNNDNKADLVITNFCLPYFHRYYGDGMGGFVTGSALSINGGSNCYDGTSADFNNDGFKDLALSNYGINAVSVFLATNNGSFAPVVNYPVGKWPEAITSGDYNNDGSIDIASANTGADTVSVLYGSPTGGFSAPVHYKVGMFPKYIESKDMNGDGKLDLVVSNHASSSNNISILINNTSNFLSAVNYTTGANPYGLVIADFNSDATPDIAVCNKSSSSVSLYLTFFPKISGLTSVCPGTSLSFTASGLGVGSYTWNTGATGPTITATPTINTTYFVTASNTLIGCATTSSVNVTMKPTPTVSVLSSNPVSCVGQAVNLTASGANSYTWNIGSNNSSLTIYLTSSYNYILSGSNSEGCVNSTAFTQSVVSCTSLRQVNSDEFDVSFFPNPSFGRFKVKSSNLFNEITIEIYNSIGQIVHKENLTKYSDIDISGSAKGIYIYVIKQNNKTVKQGKLVVD